MGDVKFHVFDSIPVDEWRSQKFEEKAAWRFGRLSSFFDALSTQDLPLVKVEHIFVDKLEKVLELERQYISEGYEGAMVLPDVPYYLGRKTNAMMKFKTMKSMDCKVVGVFEGNGKYSRSLGGIRVIQENGLECGVGSGFSDQERSEIWADHSSVQGRVCEVKFQDLSPDGIMRFPIFLRWRDQGSGGKI